MSLDVRLEPLPVIVPVPVMPAWLPRATVVPLVTVPPPETVMEPVAPLPISKYPTEDREEPAPATVTV